MLLHPPNAQVRVGTWYGLFGETRERLWPFGPMFTFDLHVTGDGVGFEAVGTMPDSMRGIEMTVSGNMETSPQGEVTYVFAIRYSIRAIVLEVRCQLNEDRTMLSGNWGGRAIETGLHDIGPCVLTRLPPEILSARPPPWEFEKDRIRALWRFALTAVMRQVLRSSYSWRFFEQRRDVRRRYIELRKQRRYGRTFGIEEKREETELERALSPADARFYVSLAECEVLRGACIHS